MNLRRAFANAATNVRRLSAKPIRMVCQESSIILVAQAFRPFSPSEAVSLAHGHRAVGLKINSKIFAMLSSKSYFVVKLPQERVDALIASGEGKRFDPGHGRLMKEWLSVESASEELWLALAKEAMEFVASQR